MKKLVFAALVAGLLLPLNEATGAVTNPIHRVVDIVITGWDLLVTSETADGTITRVEVRKLSLRNPTISQDCGGYSCSVDISSLSSGTYEVKVVCANTVYYEQFTK